MAYIVRRLRAVGGCYLRHVVRQPKTDVARNRQKLGNVSSRLLIGSADWVHKFIKGIVVPETCLIDQRGEKVRVQVKAGLRIGVFTSGTYPDMASDQPAFRFENAKPALEQRFQPTMQPAVNCSDDEGPPSRTFEVVSA
jgi:hypothetical protein